MRALGGDLPHARRRARVPRRRQRGFVGLPDGSEYLFERASTAAELAKRLLAAGAIELLRALTP